MNMNYTIDTVEDLVRILDEHPQWLDALRARLLPPAVLRPVSTALSTTLDRSRAPTPEMSPSRKRA